MQSKSFYQHFALSNFTLLALLFILNACNTLTTKETTIKGLVYDQALEAPIAGMDVHLIQEEVSPIPFGPISGQGIAVTTTDAQGNFTFNEKLIDRSKYDYYVMLDTEGKNYFGNGWYNFDYSRVQQSCTVYAGTNIKVVMPMVSNGRTLISAENRSNHPNLEFTLLLERAGIQRILYSANILANTVIPAPHRDPIPSGIHQIKWRIKGSGIDTTIVEEINVIPHQKQDYHFVFEG
jgi:hypothetical protein